MSRALTGVVGYFDAEATKLHGASGPGAPRSENVLSSQATAFQSLGCGLPDVYNMPGLGFPWTASEGLGGEGRPNLLEDDEHVGWIPPNIFEGEMDALPWDSGQAAGAFFAGLDAGHAAAPLSATQPPADATLVANSCSSHGTPETAASGITPVQNGTYCSSGESIPWQGSSETDDPQQQRQLLELSRRADTRSRNPTATPAHLQSGPEESQHLSSAGQAAARRQLAFASPQSYPGPGASPSSHDGAFSLSSLPSANSRHQLAHPENLQVTTGARQLGSSGSTLLQQRPGAWPLADSSQLQLPQRQRQATGGGGSGGDPLMFATAVSVPMQLVAEQQRQQQQQDAAHGYEGASAPRRASSLYVFQQPQSQRSHHNAGSAAAHDAAATPAEAGRLGGRCVSPVPSPAAAVAHMSPFAAVANAVAAPTTAGAASPDGQPTMNAAAPTAATAAVAGPSAGFAHPAAQLRTGWPQLQAPALQQQQQPQQQHALSPSEGQHAGASATQAMAVGAEGRDPMVTNAAAAAVAAGQPQEQQATSQGAPSATTETAARTASHAVPSSYPYPHPYPYPYPHPYPPDYATLPGAYPPRRMPPPGLAARHSDPGWAGPWGYPWPPPPYHRAPYPYPYPPPQGYPLRAVRTRPWPRGVPPGPAVAPEHYPYPPYPPYPAHPHPHAQQQQQQQQQPSLSAGAAGSGQPSAADATEAVSPTTLWGGVRLNPEAAAAARAASAGGAPVPAAGLAQSSAHGHAQGQLLHPRHSTSSSQLQVDPASAESRPAMSADASALSAQSPLAAGAAMRNRALSARRSGGGVAGPFGPAVPQELSSSAATATSPTGAWPPAAAAVWHPGYAGSGPGGLGTPPRRASGGPLSSKLPAYATPPRMPYGPAVRRALPQLPPHPAAAASSEPATGAAPAALAPAGGSVTHSRALQRWPSTGLHTLYGASYPCGGQPPLEIPPAPFLPPPSAAAGAAADGVTPVAKRLRTGLGGPNLEAMGAPAQLPSPRAGYSGFPRDAAGGGFAAPPPPQLQHHYQQQHQQQQLPSGSLALMQEQPFLQQHQQPLQL